MAAAPRQTTIDAPKAVLRFDFRNRLDQVALATLVVCGSKDRSVKPEHARALADGIRDARLQRFPGAGHLVVLERPEQIAVAVTDFAASCA
jgi:pimeloyl-ACP methyl ester carboxylesterase